MDLNEELSQLITLSLGSYHVLHPPTSAPSRLSCLTHLATWIFFKKKTHHWQSNKASASAGICTAGVALSKTLYLHDQDQYNITLHYIIKFIITQNYHQSAIPYLYYLPILK